MPLPPKIFNHNIIKKRRNKAATSIENSRFILDISDSYILERIQQQDTKYPKCLNIGCNTGSLGKQILANNIAKEMFYMDIAEGMVKDIQGHKIVANSEALPFKENIFNLVVSSISMHWLNDLPGALIQIRRSLQKNGLFIATLPGPATLYELKETLLNAEMQFINGAQPHIAPFADVKTMGDLMARAGFTMPVADSEILKINYQNTNQLVKDLRNSAENNHLTQASRYINKKVATHLNDLYKEKYNDQEGGIYATVEIITITGLAV